MSNIIEINGCCGCGECSAICPQNAIIMKKNERGEIFPYIDDKKCINCSICYERCSSRILGYKSKKGNTTQEAFVAKHIDSNVVFESRSGGVFTAISDYIFQQRGVVYGCKLIDNRTAVHCRSTAIEERNEFRGSKYIQSDITECYKQIKTDLLSGLYVLFTGTPCQVAAIKDYCSDIDCQKLLLIDIVCYGVPGDRVWNDYLSFIEKKEGKKIICVSFRNKKKYGWRPHVETIQFDDRSTLDNTIYSSLFGDGLILRENCFRCDYKNLSRVGDITLGDAWGIEKECPEYDDNKGTSLILINNQKGKTLYSKIEHNLIGKKVEIKNMIQPAICKNNVIPDDNKLFWQAYFSDGFEKTINKMMPEKTKMFTVSFIFKSKVHRILHSIINRIN